MMQCFHYVKLEIRQTEEENEKQMHQQHRIRIQSKRENTKKRVSKALNGSLILRSVAFRLDSLTMSCVLCSIN